MIFRGYPQWCGCGLGFVYGWGGGTVSSPGVLCDRAFFPCLYGRGALVLVGFECTVVHAYGHGDGGVGFSVCFISPVVCGDFFDGAHGGWCPFYLWATPNRYGSEDSEALRAVGEFAFQYTIVEGIIKRESGPRGSESPRAFVIGTIPRDPSTVAIL